MAQPFFVGQQLELFVEKLSFNGGRGVARHDGLVVFVEGSAPQERVLAEIKRVHKRFAEAKLVEIINPSSSRRTPPCPVYGECGGCNLQHITYSEQLEQKSLLLTEQLRQLTQSYDFETRPIVASDREFGYRNRVQLHVKDGSIGFHKRESHKIVNIQSCHLVEDEINHLIAALRHDGLKKIKSPRIELRSANSSGESFFSQVNSHQNEKLQKMIEKIVTDLSPTEIWDLYGGAGNFSIPLALAFPKLKITCVEGSKAAVEFGKTQSKKLGLETIEWVNAPVEKFLAAQHPRPRLILVDPPRIGLTEDARKKLIKQVIPGSKLIYLSCNPATFARDCLDLSTSTPLRLKWVQGFDLFPQTDHLEVLSLFE